MIWEFQTIWPNLRKGGIMMAHNIDKHSAFADFEKSGRRNQLQIIRIE